MLLYVIGLLLLSTARSEDASDKVLCSSGNSSCTGEGCINMNTTCIDSCKENGSCGGARIAQSCAEGNTSCVPPVEATSRLLPGSDTPSNSTSEKPVTTSSKFSPSPFLGVIPDHAVGQVFQETVGPRHTPYSYPAHQGTSREYAVSGGEPFRQPMLQHRPTSVEIQIGHGETSHGRPDIDHGQHSVYGKPDIEIRPVTGYGKTEIEIRPNAVYGHPEIEIRPQMSYESPELESRPLSSYGKPIDIKNSFYAKPGVDFGQQLGFGKPDFTFPPQGGESSGGKAAQHRQHVKPYDPGNAIEYTGYPEPKPNHPFYEAFENMKNLIKPTKGSGPYFFEDNYQEQKPIQEDTGEVLQKNPFPPAGPPSFPPIPSSYPGGPSDGAPDPHHNHAPEHHHKGGSKWKGLLRFLTTVLPFGLLIAALSPNILVINPTEQPPTVKNPIGVKRSMDAPLGPCGLRKLCEALAESPADFEEFLKAAKEGSTPELKEIIRKAEEKDCLTIECGQLQELRPTQSTVR